MTDETLRLAELLAKAGDGDFLRSVAEAVVQLLMGTDVDGLIGAARHERSGDRTIYRNGYRPCRRAGAVAYDGRRHVGDGRIGHAENSGAHRTHDKIVRPRLTS